VLVGFLPKMPTEWRAATALGSDPPSSVGSPVASLTNGRSGTVMGTSLTMSESASSFLASLASGLSSPVLPPCPNL
jgi:hypothetical protein